MGYSGFISSIYDMNNRVKMDVFYFKNWSFILDLKIVFRTTLILFKGLFSKIKFS
jgi:putative colanic acid biosynthesis UDP-glucose lipid carrier transferase